MAKPSQVGLAGGAAGFVVSLVSGPLLKFVAPIAAAALVALAITHFDAQVRKRYGTIGVAAITGLAFAIEPLQDMVRGAARGILTLFATFLLSVLGYQLSIEIHERIRLSKSDESAPDDDISEFRD
jgi:hypothetical protein